MPKATISLQATATVTQQATRSGSRFLIKPMYEGKTFRCFESGFNATRQDSVRVNRLENMRLGIIDFTPEQFYDLKGKQPVFYLQERFASIEQEDLSINHKPSARLEETLARARTINLHYDWNGLLLYALPGKKELIRQVVLDHQHDLHIVLAFDAPDSDLYYILIDTDLDRGTMEDFTKWQQDILDMQLMPLFHKPRTLAIDTYVRALTPDHYDIVNFDALFGTPVKVEGLGFMVEGKDSPANCLKNLFDKIVNIFSTPINHKL